MMQTRVHAKSIQIDLWVVISTLVQSEEEGIIIDELCPVKKTVTDAEMTGKGKEVIRLLETIDREAKERTRRTRRRLYPE